MKLNCNGIVIYSRDEAAKYDKESSFYTSYGEPWFLMDEIFDSAYMFPQKNIPRILSDMSFLTEYIKVCKERDFNINAYLFFSEDDGSVLDKKAEYDFLSISKLIGYDFLELSMSYSLVYDILVKDFSSGVISFSDDEEETDDFLMKVYDYRSDLNEYTLFDDIEQLRQFVNENSEYVNASCEKLVIPGIDLLIELSSKQGKQINEGIIYQVWKIDMQKINDLII